MRWLQFISVLYVLLPIVTTGGRNWFEPMMGPFPSRFFCQSNSQCHFGIRIASVVFHSIGMAYAWTFLVVLDLLELTYAMRLTEVLQVPKFLIYIVRVLLLSCTYRKDVVITLEHFR